MSKKIAFLIKSNIFFIIILLISLIKAQENTETKNEEKHNNKDSNENKNINFINCDKFCSKFEFSCPLIYNEVIKLATEYILDNKIIESNKKIYLLKYQKLFFIKGYMNIMV